MLVYFFCNVRPSAAPRASVQGATGATGATGAYLRLFVVALWDLIVGDVHKTHLSLLVLQLAVKDLKHKRKTCHKETFLTHVSFQGYDISTKSVTKQATHKSVVSRQNR